MYTRPAATVGLASRAGAGLPLTVGGCQCHTWLAEAALAGVNAVDRLTELCCGPCRYWVQSRLGPAACDAPAAAPAPCGSSIAPASPKAAVSVRIRAREPGLNIVHPFDRDERRPRRAALARSRRDPGTAELVFSGHGLMLMRDVIPAFDTP